MEAEQDEVKRQPNQSITLSQRRPESLVIFHTEHKLLLRSHSEYHYRELGRIAARAGTEPGARMEVIPIQAEKA